MKKWILKKLRHKYNHRFEWGEFYWHPHPKHWTFSLKLTNAYSTEKDMLVIELLLFSLYIHISTGVCISKVSGGRQKCFGFYMYPSLWKLETLVFCFGTKSKHIEMPWGWRWYSTEILTHSYDPVYYNDRRTNKHVDNRDRFDVENFLKSKHSEVYQYNYTCKDGTVQERLVKVAVERWVWRMRWFPFVKFVRKSIGVDFDEEVGEGIGTYKGGCTSCGYDIKPGETPEQTLRRMEKERKFDR